MRRSQRNNTRSFIVPSIHKWFTKLSSEPKMYANDTHLTCAGNDIYSIQSSLNRDLLNISQWLTAPINFLQPHNNCFFTCHDLLYIYFFIPQLQHIKFMSSLQSTQDNSNLALTRAKIDFGYFAQDFLYAFTILLLLVTWILDNSNLPLIRSNFCFPSDHF